MSESVQNNAEIHIEDNLDHGQGSGEEASHHVPPNLAQMPPIPLEFANNIRDLNYWPTLVAELMKQISQVPTETPPKDDKLADRVARYNPKVYDRNYDPVVLEEWVGGMEKIFTVVKVLEEKKVNIGDDIWWNTIKDKLVWPEFTGVLEGKIYPVIV